MAEKETAKVFLSGIFFVLPRLLISFVFFVYSFVESKDAEDEL